MDVSDTIVARSDQLNADDLMAGPITVQITKVARDTSGEQPVVVTISGGHHAWKPCKTMRRLLVAAWGAESDAWVGKWAVLMRDPRVKWAGDEVGGIRVKALSDIPSKMKVSLALSKGKKSDHLVDVLTPPNGADMTLEDFRKWCAWAVKNGWTSDQVKALLLDGKADAVPASERRGIVSRLKSPPADDAPTTTEEPPA
jgi:hypothetical protein